MFQENTVVLANRQLGAGLFLLTLGAKKIQRGAVPGQFVNLLCEGGAYLRRPFSFYDVRKNEVDLLVQAVGVGTRWLRGLQPGRMVDVIGPLGRGFGPMPTARTDGPLVFVTGGVGYPPRHHLYKTLGARARRIRFIHGVRGKKEAAAYGPLLHPDVLVVTEDGSSGHKGRVTDFTADLRQGTVAACGPMAMLQALHNQLAPRGVRVIISVESPMGCGYGVCFGCSLKRAKGDSYLLSCLEGPVMDSRAIFAVPGETP